MLHDTRMRESQVESGLVQCGYTDTDYLLAAQAAAAEIVTGYASIDGVDLDAELRTPNKQRGRSALRTLMDNAKRTATDFQNLRGNRLAAILSYLQEITATNPHWDAYRNALEQLAIGVEHYRG